jgi:hypothetical protein
MNWLKKGPELKMPKLKVPELKKPSLKGFGSKGSGSGSKALGIKPPAFLADLYYDLRDRRLLLPITLVVVAIAAVPILLGDSEPVEPPPVAVGAGGDDGATASASLAVVEAKPGLRDYHVRLGDRSPTDPFKQRYTGLPASAQVETESVSESPSSTAGAGVEVEAGGETTETPPSAPPSGSDDGGGSGSAPKTGELRLIEYRYTIQISHTEETADGTQTMGKPKVRRKVPLLTQLPGEKLPLVTIAGINLKTGRIYFLVSREVTSLEGDFVCTTRTPDGVCELLELEVGFPLETVYGADDARYRFKVTDIDAVWGEKVGAGASSERAAFGASIAPTLLRP